MNVLFNGQPLERDDFNFVVTIPGTNLRIENASDEAWRWELGRSDVHSIEGVQHSPVHVTMSSVDGTLALAWLETGIRPNGALFSASVPATGPTTPVWMADLVDLELGLHLNLADGLLIYGRPAWQNGRVQIYARDARVAFGAGASCISDNQCISESCVANLCFDPSAIPDVGPGGDAGAQTDGGAIDGGLADASVPDAAQPDGGRPGDGRPDAATGDGNDGGCSVQRSPSALGPAVFAPFMLLFLWRRRRIVHG